jgi:hypothetical protein
MPTQTKAIFVLSLDCEGKWGLADQISDHHVRYFTSENLRRAYGDPLALFEKWEVPATFAFVMAFTLAKEELGRYADLFEDVATAVGCGTSEETPRRKFDVGSSGSGNFRSLPIKVVSLPWAVRSSILDLPLQSVLSDECLTLHQR